MNPQASDAMAPGVAYPPIVGPAVEAGRSDTLECFE